MRAVDIGGSGGTSWAFIEGQRPANPDIQRLGTLFRDWEIPTAQALQGAAELQLKDIEFVATGGMRDGVTALKALRLGACMVGFGLPLFKAALRSEDGPRNELEALVTELKIAMMCAGIPQL